MAVLFANSVLYIIVLLNKNAYNFYCEFNILNRSVACKLALYVMQMV